MPLNAKRILDPIRGQCNVTSAGEDQDGNLMSARWARAFFWYDRDGKYRQISKEQGLSSALVDSLCLDNQGNLWWHRW